MKSLDQIIAELPPHRQVEIKRRALEMIERELGPELELETRCAHCGGYISIGLKPSLGRKCACVAVGESKPTRKRLPDPRIFGLFKPHKAKTV
jgi:hypothetical protein